MNEVHRRQTLDYAGPSTLRADGAWAWIFSAGGLACWMIEIALLIQSIEQRRGDINALTFGEFIIVAIGAILLGLCGLRCARAVGSRAARVFAVGILVGVALGLGGMVAVIFCGAV